MVYSMETEILLLQNGFVIISLNFSHTVYVKYVSLLCVEVHKLNVAFYLSPIHFCKCGYFICHIRLSCIPFLIMSTLKAPFIIGDAL